jgi:hypothetical protein
MFSLDQVSVRNAKYGNDRGLKSMSFRRHWSKTALVMGATVAFVGLSVSALAAGNDPCKVLTAEKFSQIVGYTATLDKTGSNQMNCYYQGPNHSGGHFMILTESASGPQADAMLNRRGATPPAGSGLIGGAYKQGSIIFSVSIRSTDQAALQALVAEVRRNLK